MLLPTSEEEMSSVDVDHPLRISRDEIRAATVPYSDENL
ncbi:uncharacterized protein METZ01_LOCUS435280, partial [marine metagenome]